MRTQRVDRIGKLNQLLKESLQLLSTNNKKLKHTTNSSNLTPFNDYNSSKPSCDSVGNFSLDLNFPHNNELSVDKINLNISNNQNTLIENKIESSWQWYLCGLSILNSNSIDGWQTFISQLENKSSELHDFQFSENSVNSLPYISQNLQTPNSPSYKLYSSKSFKKSSLSKIQSIVCSCWIESIRLDPRCLEAWSGLRNYGFINSIEGN
ncbi:hypothetical protein AYI69_g7906 [Smittium culicis]|uniref:Uncharacterized protein n=1 Tax=Smittium culicis TaxID=133412 RepID=A0A1R1XNL7_9FUNG|nr:hypothetical protein AYI69_g7906 [Smittium culicis]